MASCIWENIRGFSLTIQVHTTQPANFHVRTDSYIQREDWYDAIKENDDALINDTYRASSTLEIQLTTSARSTNQPTNVHDVYLIVSNVNIPPHTNTKM